MPIFFQSPPHSYAPVPYVCCMTKIWFSKDDSVATQDLSCYCISKDFQFHMLNVRGCWRGWLWALIGRCWDPWWMLYHACYVRTVGIIWCLRLQNEDNQSKQGGCWFWWRGRRLGNGLMGLWGRRTYILSKDKCCEWSENFHVILSENENIWFSLHLDIVHAHFYPPNTMGKVD